MSDFKPEPGSGFIYKNENREKGTHPEYNGTFTTPEGVTYRVACWVNTSKKNGKKYFACKIQPLDPPKPEVPQSLKDDDNDLPF